MYLCALVCVCGVCGGAYTHICTEARRGCQVAFSVNVCLTQSLSLNLELGWGDSKPQPASFWLCLCPSALWLQSMLSFLWRC